MGQETKPINYIHWDIAPGLHCVHYMDGSSEKMTSARIIEEGLAHRYPKHRKEGLK